MLPAPRFRRKWKIGRGVTAGSSPMDAGRGLRVSRCAAEKLKRASTRNALFAQGKLRRFSRTFL